MVDLTDDERAVLQALRELEPATLEEIAALTGLSSSRVKEILEAMAKKGLLDSLNSNDTEPDESDSGSA